jgi:Fe-S cluster assembly ATPase SufC
MNPLEKNGGIFVRSEIFKLTILDDRKKQVFAVIDNYDGGFDEKDIQSVADTIGITETQAQNAFMTLVGLQFLKLNKDKKWVLNENARWEEGPK